mmetsp:Transcript_5067/g.11004  ORF Transcript_5067/g.11004 Transcript_5067/m.11004 type:complete len:105 (+) Transcript_5067:451-765(+)
MGWPAAICDAIFSLLRSGADIAEPSVNDGATQFTRIAGASSAARDTVRPCIAPLLAATTAWLAKPLLAATEEKKTAEPLFFFKPGIDALNASEALITFKAKEDS